MSLELACKLVDDLARLTPSDRASQAVTISQKIKDAIEAATAAMELAALTIAGLDRELASANARTAEVAARLDVASTELAELKATDDPTVVPAAPQTGKKATPAAS